MNIPKISIFVFGMAMGIWVGGYLGENYAIRPIAIAHNCAAYDSKTGEFGWVVAPTEDQILANYGVIGSKGIDLPAKLPLPKNKPTVKYKEN